MKKTCIVVFGNIKGGTGKSTLAMHMAISLLYKRYSVASLDLDGRQGTFSRYLENRLVYAEKEGTLMPSPRHLRLCHVLHEDIRPIQQEVDFFVQNCGEDFLVIDTAGNDSLLSCYAHTLADILVTPMNDSFIDLDLLVNIAPSQSSAQYPLSTYATMVWEQRMKRASQKRNAMEWIIVRNRMHNLHSKNRAQMESILSALAKRIGFHLGGGIGERVIFRELFDNGLTLLDKEEKLTTLSHVAARQELNRLSDGLIHLAEKVRSRPFSS